MKRRLLEIICCPVCRGSLGLDVFAEAEEIEEARVICQDCGRTFPVIGAIPRLLPDELAHLLVRRHRAFFKRHAGAMASYVTRCRAAATGAWWRAESRTLASYSYQWRRFKRMLPHWERVFLDSIAPVDSAFFRGKVGLDAGCGFGRSLYYAASYGAEVIGVDLSEAVESARQNTRQLPNAHVIQADMYHLPLRKASLDFVYCIGVLHHLPDPKAGFLGLAKLLAPGAPIVIWVYSRGRGRHIAALRAVRAISTRLPAWLLNGLCLIGAAAQRVMWIEPYRALGRLRLTRPLARRLPFTWHAQYPFYVLHTDWFDGLSVPLVNYYRQQEVAEWFHEAGLERMVPDSEWGRGGGGRAFGAAPAQPVPGAAAP